MRIKEIILVLTCMIGAHTLSARTAIDFHNKALNKALAKAKLPGSEALQEISFSDSALQHMHVQGKFFMPSSEENISQVKYIYVGRVNSCRAGGCSITHTAPKDGSSEYFDYFMFFDAQMRVQLVKVYNYQATHGYEVTAKGWLKQFVGYNGSETLQVNKNIDAISGATISVYAITADIASKTDIIKKYHDLAGDKQNQKNCASL